VVMLVLTQASVGVLLAERVLSLFGFTNHSLPMLIISLVLGGAGGQAAAFHLGRPFGAWRAWLGLQTSWLSREIVLFGAYSGLLAAAVGLEVAMLFDGIPRTPLTSGVALCWRLSTLALGLAGVFSSAMIYAATQRPGWNLLRSGGKFLLTTLLAASLAAAACHAQLWFVAIGVAAVKLLYEAMCNWHSLDKYGRVSDFNSPLGQAARLVRGPLERVQAIRTALGCAAIAAMLFTSALSIGGNNDTLVLVAAVLVGLLVLAGEMVERTLFFMAMAAPKMPGGVAT